MILLWLRRFLLCGLVLLAWCPAAGAEPVSRLVAPVMVGASSPPTSTLAPVVLADGFSMGKLFSGLNSRTRIVQACVVFMCIALFIMMRR
jgi:hypothetical protein